MGRVDCLGSVHLRGRLITSMPLSLPDGGPLAFRVLHFRFLFDMMPAATFRTFPGTIQGCFSPARFCMLQSGLTYKNDHVLEPPSADDTVLFSLCFPSASIYSHTLRDAKRHPAGCLTWMSSRTHMSLELLWTYLAAVGRLSIWAYIDDVNPYFT